MDEIEEAKAMIDDQEGRTRQFVLTQEERERLAQLEEDRRQEGDQRMRDIRP